MRKVVVFDGGYGGELFADRLKEDLPVVETIRVIDWRNAEKLLASPRVARKVAKDAIAPYIGKVDLIVFANHLLTLTSLNYFKRKHRNQKFIGFQLKQPDTFINRDTLILTTRAVSKTINYYNFVRRLKRNTRTLILDQWPSKIDDGELGFEEIKETLREFLLKEKLSPKEVILACAQFSDIKRELRRALGWNVTIYDSFDDALRKTCKILGLRGGSGQRSH